MTQLDKLSSLLSRVQEKRSAPRTTTFVASEPRAAATATATAAAPAKAAPSAPRQERERGSVTEERVNIPDRVSQPQSRGAAPRPVTTDVRAPAREATAPAAQPRRPTRDRSATPLELALEGDFSRPPSPDEATTKHVAARKALEPSMSAARPAPAAQSGTEPSFVVEPEALREPARPIAQVMSKHAVEIDATFGAILKRSLSLRPR